MNNLGMERMRLQSHRQIKRFIEHHQQRYNLLSKTVNKRATCKFNANSAFLLCAVNPTGPCSSCNHYQPK